MTLNNKQDQNNAPIEVVPAINDSRRKFNKAGIITPVLLSFSSKPVWAVECGVSGTQSGNLSQQCTNPPNGFSATQFSRALAWPLPYIKESTTFDSVFGVSPNGSLFGSNVTLLSVLNKDVSVVLKRADLKAAFACTVPAQENLGDLRNALRNYAIQSVVSALNDAIFPNYTYAGPSTFFSAISGPSVSCQKRLDLIKGETERLGNLRT
jgi:hypothetical protein